MPRNRILTFGAALAVVGLAFGVRAVIQARIGGEVFERQLAEEFFDRYVTADGRVVRHDQGGDTVSEGQAYAMLLAVALDDAERFASVWDWTDGNLRRPDGLLKWRWANGRAVDDESAADADVDAAHALLLAADRFGVPTYIEEANRLTSGIAERETMRSDGKRLLAAGPWAVGQRVVNPSYFAPRAFARFHRTFRGPWRQINDAGIAAADELTDGGRRLPPDWAEVADDGHLRPIADPGSGREPGYNYDAPRLLVRFASSCDPRARRLAARLWTTLEDRPAGDAPHPLDLVARASAAHAADETAARDDLLAGAERAARERPSYYGWAWAALGRAMLDPRALGTCS